MSSCEAQTVRGNHPPIVAERIQKNGLDLRGVGTNSQKRCLGKQRENRRMKPARHHGFCAGDGFEIVIGAAIVTCGVHDPASGLAATLVAGVLLLVGATSVFVELKGSLDEMWGIEPPKGIAVVVFLRTRLHAFGLVLVLAFLLLVSLAVSAALAVLERNAGGSWGISAGVFALSSSAVSFAVIACLFAVIYKALPDAPLSWRDVWIGAVFTAGLFGLGKYAIGLYLGTSGVASSFGAAGSLIAVLLWVYYSAQIFFLGAEFTRQYALEFGSLQKQNGP